MGNAKQCRGDDPVMRALEAFASAHDENSYQRALTLAGRLDEIGQLAIVDSAIDARLRLRKGGK